MHLLGFALIVVFVLVVLAVRYPLVLIGYAITITLFVASFRDGSGGLYLLAALSFLLIPVLARDFPKGTTNGPDEYDRYWLQYMKGRRPSATTAKQPDPSVFASEPPKQQGPSALGDLAMVERCIAFAIDNALRNGCLGAAALVTIGVSRGDAVKILDIVIQRGDLVKGADGLYYPSAALEHRHEQQQRTEREERNRRRAEQQEAEKRTRAEAPGASGPQTKHPLPPEYAKALAILGVEDGALKEDMELAWKEQLKHNHPDVGGSTRLAQEINAAWDIIRRHKGWD